MIPSSGEDHLEKEMATHSSVCIYIFVSIFLPGESHGQRKSVGYSPWYCEESDRTEVTYTHAHMAETNTTLYSNHPPIKNKF